MPQDERQTWNERYRDHSRGARGPEPFLVEAYEKFIEPLFPHGGTALDVAGGTGRHALYLAERGARLGPQKGAVVAGQGWSVTLTDIAEVGIARAQAEAKRRGLSLQYLCGDTREIDFGHQRFDLVLGFFYLEREIMPRLAEALRPGGVVVYKTYTREHPHFAEKAGETSPLYFLDENELLHMFPGFRILHYEESVHERGVAELVARKPEVLAVDDKDFSPRMNADRR